MVVPVKTLKTKVFGSLGLIGFDFRRTSPSACVFWL